VMAARWLWAMILLTCASLTCAVVLAPHAGAPPVRALSWLLFTGSSVHVASTGWLFTVPAVRAYGRKHLVRCLWVPCFIVVIAAGAAAAISPAWFQWLLLPYFGWQLFHYQKQNVGMTALAASAGRVPGLLAAERWPLLVAGWAGTAALIARPAMLGLRLRPAGSASSAPGRWQAAHSAAFFGSGPWAVGEAIFLLAAATFVVSVAAGIAAFARRPQVQRSTGFCVAYLTCLLFFAPAFVFGSPFAAVAGMTIAHGLQYLLLVTLIAGGAQSSADSASPEASIGASTASPRLSRVVRLALLANVAFIGGAALGGASHLHSAGPAGRLIFGAYLGVVMSHFVIDAGLWRMRDPLARNILTTHLPYLVSAKPARAPRPVLVNAATDRSAADIECRT